MLLWVEHGRWEGVRTANVSFCTRVTQVVSEIAEESRNTQEGVRQINLVVDQPNTVTPQAAANAEELAAAATRPARALVAAVTTAPSFGHDNDDADMEALLGSF